MTLPPEITESTAFQSLSSAREEAAAIARKAQADYKRAKLSLLVCSAFASICGGLLLYSAELDPNTSHVLGQLLTDPVKTGLMVLQAVLLGAVAYFTFQLTNLGLINRWRENRLTAEKLRLSIQRKALELGQKAGPDVFRQASEGFESFMESQRSYLSIRRTNAGRSTRIAAGYGAIVAALAAASGALGGIDHALVVAIIGLLGVATPVVASAVQSWTEAAAEEKREQLHAKTATQLVEVMAESDQLHDAVEANDLDGALAYAERVFDVLRQDHKGFADLYGD